MSEQAEKSSSVQETPARQRSPEKPSPKEEKKRKWLERQLKMLTFQNPGPQIANFNPEIREMQKKEPKKYEFVSVKREGKKYDKKGRLIVNDADLCDCLDEDCLGCFYPCPKCNSTKCGPTCRCNRRWTYTTIADETGEVLSKMPFDISD
ncbi:ARL14 effector protein-like [Moschus berezovskii]|uniref:ARL14 effector protein-like n=1 Tax=Moschus berezovskii TaxID=68408 RepID=UPI002444B883|nr:ARL14 effector protein-like [Moschus berezovskii]